jgi:tetratricopeptide (TPR) repeat protein
MAEYLGITVEHDPVEAARVAARAMAPFGSEGALEHWRQVLEIAPDDLEALENVGQLLIELDEHEQALVALQRAIDLGSKDGRSWFSLGLCRYQGEDVEGALAAFEQAYELLTGDERMQAGQNRVAMLQRLGRAQEALDLRLESDPQSATDYFHLGLAQVKAGRYAECIDSITHALALEPEHANSHYTIACAYALSGDPDRALSSIARAIEIDPDLAPDIEGDDDFTSLREDPRFVALVGENAQN